MNVKTVFKSAALLAIVSMLVMPSVSFGGVFVSVSIAPPPLPVYDQPFCPGPDYIWMPGYWAYGPDGYFWVPGTWVLAPEPGLLWTPGYWGFDNGLYLWHAGYWGPHVGFYGGVDYGFGYFGMGFVGGRWEGGHFRYNTAVMHVNPVVVRNTYIDRTVIRNAPANRASFNGRGGVMARPTAGEAAAEHDRHIAPTPIQTSHERNAATNRNNFESVNHGRPSTMATSRPGTQPENRPAPNRPGPSGAVNRPAPANQARTPEQARPSERGRPEQARQPEQARPPAPENRPVPANRGEARPPAAANPAPQPHPGPMVQHGAPPHPAEAPHPAPAPRQEPANRPAPQPRQGAAEHHDERH